MPGVLRRAAEGLGLAAIVVVAMLLVVLGIDMTGRAWPSVYPTLPLSHGVAYLGVAVSGALMLVFVLPHVAGFARGGRSHADP
jgi:TRAP-type C4-dicarboxylate transport system permease small subunit